MPLFTNCSYWALILYKGKSNIADCYTESRFFTPFPPAAYLNNLISKQISYGKSKKSVWPFTHILYFVHGWMQTQLDTRNWQPRRRITWTISTASKMRWTFSSTLLVRRNRLKGENRERNGSIFKHKAFLLLSAGRWKEAWLSPHFHWKKILCKFTNTC